VLEGLIAGITAAKGYGAGVAVASFIAELTEGRMSPPLDRRGHGPPAASSWAGTHSVSGEGSAP